MGMEAKRTKKGDTGWSDIKGGQAFVLPVLLLQHENFIRLSPFGCKLLFDLGRQFSGSNNGYLHPGINVMKPMGWRSAHTLTAAIKELLHYRIIVQTVQGGKNRPSYYGFTFRKITEKAGRPFDRPLPVIQPSNDWERSAPPFESKSLVHVLHKVSAPDAQVTNGFVHDVHKQPRTCAPDAQVGAISEGGFVHDVHSYSSMPYPIAKDGAPSGSTAASDSSSRGSESNRRRSQNESGQPSARPKAA